MKRVSKMIKPPRKRRPRTMTLYLGWDGAYVLSPLPLKKFAGDGNGPFLATGVKFSCVDLQREGDLLFKKLGLKDFEVVKLKIEVQR